MMNDKKLILFSSLFWALLFVTGILAGYRNIFPDACAVVEQVFGDRKNIIGNSFDAGFAARLWIKNAMVVAFCLMLGRVSRQVQLRLGEGVLSLQFRNGFMLKLKRTIASGTA